MPDESELLRALTRDMTPEEITELTQAINDAPPPKPEGPRAKARKERRRRERLKERHDR